MPKPAKTKGIIIVDSREKPMLNDKGVDVGIRSLADEVKLLTVPNEADPAHPWSYDIRIVTKAEQPIRVEAKWDWVDCYSSWADRESDDHSRLWRQTRYVDLLLVVWDDFKVELQAAPEQRPRIKGLKNRLGRMVLESDPPVLMVGSVADALAFLVYLRDQTDPIRLGRLPGPELRGPAAHNGPQEPNQAQ